MNNKYTKLKIFYNSTIGESLFKANMIKEEKIKKLDIYESYMSIVKDTCKLIKELGIKDPYNASAIFDYLLWNGYLSKDKTLKYSISNRTNLNYLAGTDIMTGRSVCINNADMLSRVLNELGYESFIFVCRPNETEEKKNTTYKPNIKRKKDNITETEESNIRKFLLKLPFFNKIGTHAITIFNFCNNYSFHDPTNIDFLNAQKDFEVKFVCSDLSFQLNPFDTSIINNVTKECFMKSFESLYNNSNQLKLDKMFVEKTFDYSILKCIINSSLLNDFYEEITPKINETCKRLEKYK